MTIDESLHDDAGGLYVLAAVAVAADVADSVRHELRGLLGRRQRRLHWNAESIERRDRIADVIGRTSVTATAYVRTGFGTSGPAKERARSKCLGQAMWDLREEAASTLVLIESRDRADNRDRATIAHRQREGWLSKELRYEFPRPADEPLLWIPDAVAGAVAARQRGEAHPLELMGDVAVVLVQP